MATMIIKFQRPRLTFDLSAKVAHISFINTCTSQKPLKFHMKTPNDKLVKIYTNCSGHTTKMVATPIYGKNPLKIFGRTGRPMTLGLGM